MKKIHQNIIIGSGFSAFALNFFLKKEFLVITTKTSLISNFPKRENLTRYLKIFSQKFSSLGTLDYNLVNSNLHDTLIHGGNTNFWGGICNIGNIKNLLKFFRKTISFKKISINETGSYSDNKYLYQMQKINSQNATIFNCSNQFKRKIYGHLIRFESLNKNIIKLQVQRKKQETFLCRNLILAINTTQLIELLINSGIIADKDVVSLDEHKFKTKVSFFKNLKIKKNKAVVLSYSVSGIIKHALGFQKNFNKYLFNFFNFIPFYYHQIFYKNKIRGVFQVHKKTKNIQEISKKTTKNFGNSIHYHNMKINKSDVGSRIKYFNKRIYGISSPFVKKATPGPISNFLIKQSYNLAKKLNK